MDPSPPNTAMSKLSLAEAGPSTSFICTNPDPTSPSAISFKTTLADDPLVVQSRTFTLPFRPAPPAPSGLRCPIDLEDIAPDEAYALPCGHVFHHVCIEHWLGENEHNPTCPTCRMDVRAFDRFWDDDKDELSYWPKRWTGEFVDSDSESDSADATDSSSPTISEESSSSSEEYVRLPVQQLAFHLQFIEELKIVRSRAIRAVVAGTEVALNTRWAAFITSEIQTHETLAEHWEGYLNEFPDGEDGI
ncbi:hypothetical protein LTR56_024791 [Elasticomyces elasticus]|nr:hypothetical protein LTR56_024791 [Elasticomyces elasticus]KAK3632080.1 hypothetical protein LTR22_020729 [Elasticomyces elasticus]KAK4914126.1 hypothetical protein LTR49_017637 [Elasticomyces elasticus]KAK5762252.1 hypothetical protein LTS12_007595 [Elasticomyces elasticus]